MTSRHIAALAFSPNGKRLATGTYDGILKLWEFPGGQERSVHHLNRHLNGLAFSPDGTMLASTGADRRVRLWDAQDGQEICILSTHVEDDFQGLAFSPDGKLLAVGSGHAVWLFDVPSRNALWSRTEDEWDVPALAFSPDGSLLASSSSGGLRIRDVWDGETRLTMGSKRVMHIAFSPDGQRIFSATWHTSCIFNVDGGGTFEYFTGGGKAAIANDWTRLATFVTCESTIFIYDPRTAQELCRIQLENEGIRCCAFSPDGEILVCGTTQGMIRAWDVTYWREILDWRGYAEPPVRAPSTTVRSTATTSSSRSGAPQGGCASVIVGAGFLIYSVVRLLLS